jgi:hypothetical protein
MDSVLETHPVANHGQEPSMYVTVWQYVFVTSVEVDVVAVVV